MEIGILGAGHVGRALARGLADLGHRVTLGTRTPAHVTTWSHDNPGIEVSSLADTASGKALLILSVPGTAAAEVVGRVATHIQAETVVIDTCDPFASSEPVDAVLPLFTTSDESLLERLQARVPHARMVKAFNTVGVQYMVQPDFPDGPPSMFLCGDDAAARAIVATIITSLGWEPIDLGSARSARVLEPMASLYCAIGYHSGQWNHAIRVLRRPQDS